MAQNRYVSTNFWKDNYVVELDPTEKLIFIYLLTNPKTNIAGIYEINIREIAFDTGFDVEVIRRALDKFMAEGKIIVAEGWLGLRNWLKHQSINPSVRQGIDRQLRLLPDKLKQYVLTDDAGHNVGVAWDSLYTAYSQAGTYLTLPNGTNLTLPNGTNVAENHERRREKTKQIDNMFLYWEATVGYKVTAKVKQNREYAGKLLNDYLSEEIAEAIHVVARASEDRFAPRIANFIDLYRKWDDLKLWDKRQVRGKTGVTAI
jgi:hypothetical protein